MPTRLPVLLQSRKSALAGAADSTNIAVLAAMTAVQRLAAIGGKRVTIRLIGSRGCRVIGQVLSTTMARKSFTLVKVGPGTKTSPRALKKAVESLSARNAAGSRPRALARL